MTFEQRKIKITEIEELRNGRTLVSLCNFDRASFPILPGLSTPFLSDLKECLFRVLKESAVKNGLDIFLYTRGGDTNSVWPIVCLLREFDRDFQVLIPFRAHSAGTMLAISASKVVMTKLGELSPIDPTTGNVFNPIDQLNTRTRLGISVEDVNAYRSFVCKTLNLNADENVDEYRNYILPFLMKLIEYVHPLALGNVHRVNQLVEGLAKKLMESRQAKGDEIESIVKKLTVQPFSHLHMIGRDEAKEILGTQFVESANDELEAKIDGLLKDYEDTFHLREQLFASRLMKDVPEIEIPFRFIGGLVESKNWSYLFETRGQIVQFLKIPQGVNVQIPAGQPMPLVEGLPKEYNIEVFEQRWYRNIEPEGVTL